MSNTPNFPTIEQWNPPISAFIFMKRLRNNEIHDEDIDQFSQPIVSLRGYGLVEGGLQGQDCLMPTASGEAWFKQMKAHLNIE
jgi:hypothetical protein